MKGFDYTIKNKPTRYNGIQFRSRLEAKWAAFFDLLNWKWEYEPCDFDGWIPDFVIVGREELIFVEVKPIYPFHKFDETVNRIMKNIETCNCKGIILLVGLSLFDMGCGELEPDSEISVGMIYAPDPLENQNYKRDCDPTFYGRRDAYLDRDERSWDRGIFGLWEGGEHSPHGYINWNNTYGLYLRQKTNRDLITDCYDMNMDCEEAFYGENFAHHKLRIQQLWKQATNIVQWNNYGDSSITSIIPSDNTNKIPSRA